MSRNLRYLSIINCAVLVDNEKENVKNPDVTMVRVLSELANDRLESGDSGTVPYLLDQINLQVLYLFVGIVFFVGLFSDILGSSVAEYADP